MKYLLPEKKALLAGLVKSHCVQFGDFELSAGGRSNYFIDGSKLWTSELLYTVADCLLETLHPFPQQIGGPSVGADPLVGAMLLLAKLRGRILSGFVVKKDGAVEGICEPKQGTIIVEDVVTTGTQTQKALRAAEAKGALILGIVAVVDRQAGASKLFKGYNYHALLDLRDLGITPQGL